MVHVCDRRSVVHSLTCCFPGNVPLLHMSSQVIAHDQFYQAFPRVRTASNKRWGEMAWVRGQLHSTMSRGCLKFYPPHTVVMFLSETISLGNKDFTSQYQYAKLLVFLRAFGDRKICNTTHDISILSSWNFPNSVSTIYNYHDINTAQLLLDGNWTIENFYAPWCITNTDLRKS